MLDIRTLANYILKENMPLQKLHILCYLAQVSWAGEFGEKLFASQICAGPYNCPIVEDITRMFPQYKDITAIVGAQETPKHVPEPEKDFLEYFFLPVFFDQSVEDLKSLVASASPFAAARAGLADNDPVLVPINEELVQIYGFINALERVRAEDEESGSPREGLYAVPACFTRNDLTGQYEVDLPQYPDIHEKGGTIADAMKNAQDAVLSYLLKQESPDFPKKDAPLPKCSSGSLALYLPVDLLATQIKLFTSLEEEMFYTVSEENRNSREEYCSSSCSGSSAKTTLN